MPTVGISQVPTSTDGASLHMASSNTNVLPSSSSKSTVNVILNNVAPPIPTVVTAASPHSGGSYKQQSISSTVTVNPAAVSGGKSSNTINISRTRGIIYQLISVLKYSFIFQVSYLLVFALIIDIGIGRLEMDNIDHAASTSALLLWLKSFQNYFLKRHGKNNIEIDSYFLLDVVTRCMFLKVQQPSYMLTSTASFLQ